MFYWLARPVVILLLKLLSRWEVSGRENLPGGGPLLVIFNHLGHLDPPLLMATFPWRFTGLAVAGLRKVPLTGAFLQLSGVIWVNRSEYDREALRKALHVLEKGGVLGIAPEGRISVTGALERAKNGPIFLAQRANVPILPVAITGTEKALAELRRWRRPHLRVAIGRPFRLDASAGEVLSRREELRRQADLLMLRLAELLPSEYRGVYADRSLAELG
ncbi:MAG: 1-acyl-sn-glycerol-3-phosphate acyltransferase [Chloroflexi bacterium]|nr:1-acyl-sn-glycerol-3-phosphate acyltransferase [Chloroflexota bacterium]